MFIFAMPERFMVESFLKLLTGIAIEFNYLINAYQHRHLSSLEISYFVLGTLLITLF